MPAAEQRAERYLSVKASAEIAGCDEKTIRRAIESGDLPASRPRGTRLLRVAETDLRGWLEPVPALGRQR